MLKESMHISKFLCVGILRSGGNFDTSENIFPQNRVSNYGCLTVSILLRLYRIIF